MLTVFLIILAVDLLFAAVRASLVHARLPQLVSLREAGHEAVERTLALLEKPRMRVSLRVAVVVVHFLLAVVSWQAFLEVSGLLATTWLALGVMLGVVVLLVVVEFVIEGWFLRKAEHWAIRLTWLGQLIDWLFRPLTLLVMRFLGSSPAMQRQLGSVTEDELKNWVETDQPEGGLEQGERKMIYSIFQFSDTLCREVMVPRIDLFALDVNSSLPDAIQAVVRYGHSRIPVYEDVIDNLLGILYAKDLLRVTQGVIKDKENVIRSLLRPAYFVPEAKKVDALLREMQSNRVHIAVVVDEYGGIAGLVTLEDIVEEIVGEIRDEYDQGEELLYQVINPDEMLFQGKIGIDDLNDLLGTHLSKEVSDTLAGFVYSEIGRVPVGNEELKVGEWALVVEQVSGRRIRKVRAKRQSTEPSVEEKKDDSEQ